MKKEKKIKINYITYINKHYIPSAQTMKKWILISLMKEYPISGKYNFCWTAENKNA
jgi:hypothetical protein